MNVRWVVPLLCLVVLPGCRARPPYEGRSAAELEKMLHDGSPVKQAQGALGLSLLGPEARGAVPALVPLLRSPDILVRQNAALALGKVGPEARGAVPALAESLRDPEWTVRRHAALALGAIGPEALPALPGLEKLARDPDPLVRKAAESARARIRPANRRGSRE